jgi:hypothetical protein
MLADSLDTQQRELELVREDHEAAKKGLAAHRKLNGTSSAQGKRHEEELNRYSEHEIRSAAKEMLLRVDQYLGQRSVGTRSVSEVSTKCSETEYTEL